MAYPQGQIDREEIIAMIRDMQLTKKQLLWLKLNGGKDEEDVHLDENGHFVLMYHPQKLGKREKVYIPLSTFINI